VQIGLLFETSLFEVLLNFKNSVVVFFCMFTHQYFSSKFIVIFLETTFEKQIVAYNAKRFFQAKKIIR